MAEVWMIGNMDDFRLERMFGLEIEEATSSVLRLEGPLLRVEVLGSGLTYDAQSQLSGGKITEISFTEYRAGSNYATERWISLKGIDITATLANQYLYGANTPGALAYVLSGSDVIRGWWDTNLLRGFDGNDTILGEGGSNTIFGGPGNDSIWGGGATAAPGQANFLRGEDGDDLIVGTPGFDDMHGNTGNDTLNGGNGSDWVVGGQGNDVLRAGDDRSDNVVYGNLGNDSCVGGFGVDWIRGGQGHDTLSGGGGADLLWGDRGGDLITGGGGADVFSIFGEADIDRILDFNYAEGDRLRVEAGYTYTVAQDGADVVVNLSGGAEARLVGVQLSSLPAGWII